MYQEIKYPNWTKEQQYAHLQKWGGHYNHLPPNVREISFEEFAQSGFFTWCKEGMEFRQVSFKDVDPKNLLKPVSDGLHSITMFYMNHDSHFIMMSDYWGKTVRFFTFTDCYHEYDCGVGTGNCLHLYTCKKCGYKWEVDSSG